MDKNIMNTEKDEHDEDDNDFLSRQIWSGPKIAKYGSKYLGVYDLNVNEDEVGDDEFLLMDNAFNEISKKLRYNEFRRLLWKGQTECYQFIRSIGAEEVKDFKSGRQDQESFTWTTQRILDYARNRAKNQSTHMLNQHQVKNRSGREQKWKKWYQNRLEEDAQIEERKINFLQEFVEPIKLKYGDRLLDFQQSHVRNLLACLNQKGVALDASDTGTGKTYSALCLAKELGLIPIIVCPKSIIPGWKRAMKHFDHTEFYVSNYEQYRAGNTPYLTKKGANPHYRDFNVSGNSSSSGSDSGSSDEGGGRMKMTGSGGSGVNREWQRYERERSEKQYKENLSKIPKIEYTWKLDEKHLLIFDECHKTKNTSTQNYAIYWWARQKHMENGLKVLSLSATVADKIVNAYGICFMLGQVSDGQSFNLTYNLNMDKGILKDFGYEVSTSGFYKFNRAYQEAKETFQNEDTNLRKLHHDFFPMNGSRMVIDDLGDSFPENFIEAQAYDMDRRADQIQKIYREMEQSIMNLKFNHLNSRYTELQELENQDFTTLSHDQIDRLNALRKDHSKDDQQLKELRGKLLKYGSKVEIGHLNKTSFGNEKKNMLTVMLKARQRVELLKADTLVELGIDFLEQGKSVVIFVNFIETLEYLQKQFQSKGKQYLNSDSPPRNKKGSKKKNDPTGISIIRGGQSTEVRQNEIDLFQSNHNRLIIASMGSGRESISLHDLNGNHPRVSLISPSWSAQDLIQALGRIHRAEGKSKCLQYLIYCAGTIEDRICEIIQQKVKTINAINDGDLSEGLF